MMFSSIRTRLWITYIVIIGVVLLTLFSAVVIFLVKNPLILRQDIQRINLISILIAQRSSDLLEEDSALLQDAIFKLDQSFNVRVIMMSPTGEVLIDSRGQTGNEFPPLMDLNRPKFLNNNMIRDSQGRVWNIAIRTLPDAKTLIVASPRIRFHFLTLFKDELLAPFIQAAVLAFVISLLLSFWIAKWLTSPLKRIEAATTHLASGRYDRIIPEGPGEIQNLILGFNEMVNKVQASQQAQRDLVANVSHELKTPLTSIKGFAQAIMENTVTNEEGRNHAAHVIFSEAERMNHLVSDLLDLAKYDSGITVFHFSLVDLHLLIKGIMHKFEPIALSDKVSINAKIPDSIMIECDPEKLAQVFNNLIDNALKFTREGGKVEVIGEVSGDVIMLRFEDGGPGIPEGDLGRVFERFYQVDKARASSPSRGVGLGLAIAYEIVVQHHGLISAKNRTDDSGKIIGSAFHVSLPLKQPEHCS